MSRPKYDTPAKLQTHLDEFFRNNPKQNHAMLVDMGITSLVGVNFPETHTYLALSNNQITSLKDINFPRDLSVLQVPMNQITSLDGVAFPHKLTDIQLQQNQITSLDGIVFPAGLVSLDLSNNKITSFAGMQFPLSLFSLKLAGNPIDVRTVSELKNPSPFVIREIVAAFPETDSHFQRIEEEKGNLGEKVEQMLKMLYALNMKTGGRKNKTARRTLNAQCRIMQHVQNGGNQTTKRFQRRKSKNKKSKNGWSLQYKKSINCKRPRGFSQRQYCNYGRKKSYKK